MNCVPPIPSWIIHIFNNFLLTLDEEAPPFIVIGILSSVLLIPFLVSPQLPQHPPLSALSSTLPVPWTPFVHLMFMSNYSHPLSFDLPFIAVAAFTPYFLSQLNIMKYSTSSTSSRSLVHGGLTSLFILPAIISLYQHFPQSTDILITEYHRLGPFAASLGLLPF